VARRDLVQECLLAVHNQRHTYQSDQPLTAWVHAIARYKLIDLLRAKGSREALHQPLDDELAVFAESATDASDARRDLGGLLESLPDRHRLPIVHVKLHGLSIAEAARATGMSESAVKVGIHRGLKALALQASRRPDEDRRPDLALLAADAPPVPRHATRRRLDAGAGVVAARCRWPCFVAGFGLRRDLIEALFWPMFWVKVLFPVAIAVAGFVLVQRLARPGMRGGLVWPADGRRRCCWSGCWRPSTGWPRHRPSGALLWGPTWRICAFSILADRPAGVRRCAGGAARAGADPAGPGRRGGGRAGRRRGRCRVRAALHGAGRAVPGGLVRGGHRACRCCWALCSGRVCCAGEAESKGTARRRQQRSAMAHDNRALNQYQEHPMALSLYDLSVPVFLRGLGQLALIVLDKGLAHAQANDIDTATLVERASGARHVHAGRPGAERQRCVQAGHRAASRASRRRASRTTRRRTSSCRRASPRRIDFLKTVERAQIDGFEAARGRREEPSAACCVGQPARCRTAISPSARIHGPSPFRQGM
jgi:RNA polymerase sigma factor (sigma-70 family)